jgi:dolichol-phosphate mannosyltransferase
MMSAAESVQAEPSRGPLPDLWIVVPVFNEAENFPTFYRNLKEHVRTPHTVLVVYDFEEDTTLPSVREIQKTDPTLRLLKNESRGVAAALRTGLRFPQHGAVLVTMADCSDDHRQVDEMYRQYQLGSHVVAASRYAPGGAQRGGPLVKRTLSRLAGASLHLVAGIPTWDPTNSFKLYSTELLGQVDIESAGGFEVGLELTVKAHNKGLRIAELPTVWTDRVAGKSNFKLGRWLPRYLRWYGQAMAKRGRQLLGR